ncbi:GEMI7 protein, partial [Alcedo cyanopectus]|nr:GEMI7 protein [Ceyx cyanopectus]
AALRERYLRVLAASRGLRGRFRFRSGLEASGVLGAVDLESAAFQVDGLGTPLGVQEAALLRGGDLLSFSFLVA